ncbi:MAG: LysM peptidoglycan-binding domain-containing protein, partial [Bacteroidia bacterium]|nr:LysM peptidoglycan-binding domain-containing protein [Bacteroidia bacterium]
ENPDVFNGIKIGQVLKIPVIPGKNSTKEEILYSDDYMLHKVEKGQTAYSIAKKFNISVEEIYKHTPEAEKGITIGQTIKIPKKPSSETSVKDKQEGEREEDIYYYHEVKKKETLYSISKQYHISINQLIKDNPELKETGAVAGQIIKIQKLYMKQIESPELEIDTTTKIHAGKVDSVNIPDRNEAPCGQFNYIQYGKPFNIAVMLPFNLDMEDVKKEEENNDGKPYFPKGKPFLEFYEGALIAVDSLKKKGININLYVYNSYRDSASTIELLKKDELKLMDIIIGPAFSTNLKYVAEFAKAHKINVVSPFYSKKEFTVNNPYIFQVNPSLETQLQETALFFAKYKDKNIILVSLKQEAETGFLKIFKQNLLSSFAEFYKNDSLSIKEADYEKEKIKAIEEVLSPTKENVIIIPSSDQAFISDLITKLNTFSRKNKIILFGLPEWRKFENIELEYIHNLNMVTFSPYYIDYFDNNVQHFLEKYRLVYNTEPVYYGNCNYSFCGYDIMLYFLQMLMKYGRDFRFCLQQEDMLQSKYSFVRIDEFSGFENTGTYILHYDIDYSVNKIEPRNFKIEEVIFRFNENQ